MAAGEENVDYMALLNKAVGSKYDDMWAERTDPNSGPPLNAAMFHVSQEFAEDYARVANERYAAAVRR
jgi:hypothetical protein